MPLIWHSGKWHGLTLLEVGAVEDTVFSVVVPFKEQVGLPTRLQ